MLEVPGWEDSSIVTDVVRTGVSCLTSLFVNWPVLLACRQVHVMIAKQHHLMLDREARPPGITQCWYVGGPSSSLSSSQSKELPAVTLLDALLKTTKILLDPL